MNREVYKLSREDMDNNRDWCVYILRCADGTYYVGITDNIENRLKKHQLGKAARYTAQRLPVTIVYSQEGYTQSEARKEEIILKDWRREKKEKLIKGKISRHTFRNKSSK